MSVSLVNFTTLNIPSEFFEKITQKVLEKEGYKEDVLIEVVLLGEKGMRNINKRYAGKNQVTDVLSFAFSEIKKATKKDLVFVDPPDAQKVLGEILLCPSKIKKNAKKFKKDLKEELAFVFVHGLLHLLGYDHKDTKSTNKMREKEKEILKRMPKKKWLKS